MNEKDTLLRASLNEYLSQLQKAITGLDDAFQHCQAKPLEGEDIEPRDLESYDALAMRFSRTADIFTQKVLRCTLSLLREEAPTFIDSARLAEKLGLVSSADQIILIRDLRNSIAHEYIVEDWSEIFQQIMQYTPMLLNDIKTTRAYIKNKFDIR